MSASAVIFDDELRIASLDELEIIDSPAEETFDAITRAAALACETPIALVSLVHRDRQWFKSVIGLDVTETPRDISFCDFAIRGQEIFEVPDALVDSRFADNPLVKDRPNIRFYAGIPLLGSDEQPLGTLCVIDRAARRLTERQKSVLGELSKVAILLLEARRSSKSAEARLRKIVAIQAQLADAELDLDRFLSATLARMGEETAANGAILVVSDESGLTIRVAAGAAATGLGLRLNSKSLCGQCIAQGETLISADCETDPRVDREALARAGARSAICMPLVRHGRTFGAVMLMAPIPRAFEMEHSHLLHLMTGMLSAAFEHRLKFDANRALTAEQGRTLEALSEAEARFRGSFATATHGMAIVSLQGRFLEVNKALCTMMGYSEEELQASDFQSITHPDDLAIDLRNVETLLAGKASSHQREKRYKRKDGQLLWVHLAVSLVRGRDDAPRYFVAQMQDLTAQKRLEEAQRRIDNRFKRLIQGVTDYAIYTLSPEGKVTTWNAGAERIKGYTVDKIVGRHFDVFFTNEARENGEPQRILKTAEREGKFEGEGERVRADGSRFWAHVVLDAIRDGNGELVGYTKITRDITDAVGRSSMPSDLTGQSIPVDGGFVTR